MSDLKAHTQDAKVNVCPIFDVVRPFDDVDDASGNDECEKYIALEY